MSFEGMPQPLERNETETESSDFESLESVEDFVDKEGGFLTKLKKGRLGKLASSLMLMTTLSLATAGYARGSESEFTLENSNTETSYSLEESEEKVDAIATHVIKILTDLKVSARPGKVLGEKVIKEDILGKYIPMMVSLKKVSNENLSDTEAHDLAYDELGDALERVADHVGDKDGDLDESEKEWLEDVTEKVPGLKILKQVLSERDKESGKQLPENENSETTNLESESNETVLESKDIDTSAY